MTEKNIGELGVLCFVCQNEIGTKEDLSNMKIQKICGLTSHKECADFWFVFCQSDCPSCMKDTYSRNTCVPVQISYKNRFGQRNSFITNEKIDKVITSLDEQFIKLRACVSEDSQHSRNLEKLRLFAEIKEQLQNFFRQQK